MEPKFFPTPDGFVRWLEKHHATATELLVGFHKTDSGKASMTWPESVDAALRFGWIDGVRRRIDQVSYSIRFTPRRPGSTWSVINMKRVKELAEAKLLHAAGEKALANRLEARSGVFSYEQKNVAFEPAQEKLFRAAQAAWKFFVAQAPSYQRAATWWVISAKREETRVKRLKMLIEDSAEGRRLKHLTRP